jgi:hypothetical protein
MQLIEKKLEMGQAKLRKELIENFMINGLREMCKAENLEKFTEGAHRVVADLSKNYGLVLQGLAGGEGDLTFSNFVDTENLKFSKVIKENR